MALGEEIVTIICDELGVTPNQCTDDARLVHDLGADSLDAINLTMHLEEFYDIEIPDAEAEKLTTVGEVVIYIGQHVERYRKAIADATGAP